MTATDERYAIYWAPDEDHPLWTAGCSWLGRDPSLTTEPSLPEASRAHVRAPTRYGFHATLKAPMRLAAGRSFEELRAAAAALARRHRVFEMPALEVAWLQDFLALRPVAPLQAMHPLRRLADSCVAELDEYRAPPPGAEIARRAEQAGGDAAGLALLARWGYAHVFDTWRFHMTLSDALSDRGSNDARQLEHEARAWFAPSLALPLQCGGFCIFREAAAGKPLRLIERLPLEGAL